MIVFDSNDLELQTSELMPVDSAGEAFAFSEKQTPRGLSMGTMLALMSITIIFSLIMLWVYGAVTENYIGVIDVLKEGNTP